MRIVAWNIHVQPILDRDPRGDLSRDLREWRTKVKARAWSGPTELKNDKSVRATQNADGLWTFALGSSGAELLADVDFDPAEGSVFIKAVTE